MAAPKNFVAGFNHNIKHGGQIFHVQTEDSGAEIGVVATHLFVGGTILATRRDSYEALRGAPDLQQQVRARMEAQHKKMLRDVANGEFEGAAQQIPSYQPGQLALRSELTPPPPAPVRNGVLAGILTPPPPDAMAPQVRNGAFAAILTPPPPGPMAPPESNIAVAAFLTPPEPVHVTRFPGPASASSGKTTRFDNGIVGAVPPPGYVATPGPPGGTAPVAVPVPDRRVSGPRPFGEDLISDKTLDQVILAYLVGEKG